MQANNKLAFFIQSFQGKHTHIVSHGAIETIGEKHQSPEDTVEKHKVELTSESPATLMIEEDREFGQVAFSVYRAYIRAAGGIGFILLLLFGLSMVEIARVGYVVQMIPYCLSHDTNQGWFVEEIFGFRYGSITDSPRAPDSMLGYSQHSVLFGYYRPRVLDW